MEGLMINSVDLLEDYGYEYSPRRRGDPES